MKCPKCNFTTFVKAGKTQKGTQRYQCKKCGLRRTETFFERFNNKGKIKCWKCGSTKIKKNGLTRIGKQLYFCKDCKHKFVEFEKTRFLQKHEKEFIIKYHYGLGVSLVDIAKHLNRSDRAIYCFIRKYKKEKGIK